jgi:lactoylglutathione lyase
MKFCWSTLQVKDLDESIEFYGGILGLSVERRFKAGPAVEIAFLGEGETKIELICDPEKEKIEIGPDISWGFVIESADDMMSYLKEKKIDILGGIIQPNPQLRFFYIHDPNGLKIQLVEHIRRRAAQPPHQEIRS